MVFLKRSVLICFVILLSLISVACGELRISASTGDESGSSGYTESLGAQINDQIHESTALAGSSLSQSFASSGDKSETFAVTNKAGDHAEVGFNIIDSVSYSGSYTLSPETANYAKATEKLNVNTAESIYAFAYATTRDKYETAALDLSITKGSLVEYANSAYATSGKATVDQKMKSASGQSIWLNEMAWKGLDYNNLDYFVGDGLPSTIQNGKPTDYAESATAMNEMVQEAGAVLTDYSGSATATNKMAQKKITLGSFSTPANWMRWGSYGYNKEGDNSNSLIQITNGQLSKYSMAITATPTCIDLDLKADSAEGDNIDVSGHSYNPDYENAVLGFSVTKGSMVGYANSAYATLGKATVDQKMKSASGESMWGSEMAGKGQDYSDLDYYVGDLPYSPSSNNGLTAVIPDVTILTNYHGSATATNKMAQQKRTIGSLSTDWMDLGSYAYNREGDNSNSLIQITNGQLSKYSLTTTATPTYVDSIEMVGSAKGDDIYASEYSYNSEGDNSWVSIADSGTGSLKNLYLNPHADLNGVESFAKIASISGSSIEGTGTAFNAEGDSSQMSIEVTSGLINNWNSDNQANKGSATNPYMYLASAKGSLIDIKSHAENRRAAYEGFSDPVDYGGADFEVQAKSLTSTRIKSTATSNDVLITPTLPKGIKTAIMLEPFQCYAAAVTTEKDPINNPTASKVADLGTTVFPTLVNKGYATLRYTDSAASKDKYKDLGKYNVVLAEGHMDANTIYLSTAPDGADRISYSELKYKKSKDSLVILAGCNSLEGYPTTKLGLATAVGKASVSGGFADEVYIPWTNYYVSSFFEALGDGNTASDANSIAHAAANQNYGPDSTENGFVPLVFYGNQYQTFKL